MNSQPIIKSFGTILTDNKSVQQNLKKFRSSGVSFDFEIPKNFDGRDVWKFYLSEIQSQGYCGNCWAIASVGVLSDRFSLLSKNYIKPYLSSAQVTICDGIINDRPERDYDLISEQNLRAHTDSSCFGNSIINAIKFLYVYGAVENQCFNYGYLLDKGVNVKLNKVQASQDLPTCQSVFGIDFNTCPTNIKVAAKFFRASTYYPLPNDEMRIKREIFKFGPIVSGFIVYDDFLNEYDGLSIYMGPKEGASPTGGHAIRIVGWGEENGVKYWIIANSWGKEWGENGYFKMKIGIKECELETNMAALLPDLPFIENPYLSELQVADKDAVIERNDFEVDKLTGYTDEAMVAIKREQKYGNLSPIFPERLKYNLKDFYAGKVEFIPRIFLDKKNPELMKRMNILKFLGLLIFVIILTFIILKIFYNKR